MAHFLKKAKRFNEILTILIENGFFELLYKLITAERKGHGALASITVPPELPAKVRHMLEILGPTFIKIGQLLATRPDLVPREFVEEFKKMYDAVEPAPYEEVKKIIESELQRPIEKIFKEFDKKALASASIAQVHRATLHTGEKVAVKVQHAHIEENMKLDFEILQSIVNFLEREFYAIRVWQPKEHLYELQQMVEKELDFTNEAKNQDIIRKAFIEDKRIKIPVVYWEYTRKRVLVMEFIDGIKLSNLDDPRLQNIDKINITKILTEALAKQVFVDRVFHADPSPGNLMVIDSNTVAMLDFGAIAQVSRKRSESLVHLMVGFLLREPERVARSVVDICNVYGHYDEREFLRDVEKIVDYHEREHVSPADPRILDMIIALARKHNMLLPPDFILITRALFQNDGLCRKLVKGYELVEYLEPFIKKIMLEKYEPEKQEKMFAEASLQYLKFFRRLPVRLNNIIRRLESQDFKLNVEITQLNEYKEYWGEQIERVSATGVVIAIILGFALILSNNVDMLIPFTVISMGVLVIWLIFMTISSNVMRRKKEF